MAIERVAGQALERATFSAHQSPEATDRVHALEQARAALDDARQRSAELETIIETMIEGVLVFDANRHVTLLNAVARQLLNTFTGLIGVGRTGFGNVETTAPDAALLGPVAVPDGDRSPVASQPSVVCGKLLESCDHESTGDGIARRFASAARAWIASGDVEELRHALLRLLSALDDA